MQIYMETSLENFEAWSGAVDTLNTLIEKDLCDQLEKILECDIFPDGCTDTELNDFLWCEEDYIAELLGFSSWEALENDGEEDEEIDMDYLNECIDENTDFDNYCSNADCGTCPFNAHFSRQDGCENAYNLMLNGYSFEEAIVQ